MTFYFGQIQLTDEQVMNRLMVLTAIAKHLRVKVDHMPQITGNELLDRGRFRRHYFRVYNAISQFFGCDIDEFLEQLDTEDTSK